MAFSSLFTLLDDISSVLDDVATMTKVASKKTAGVIGDDLALNANQVSGKNISPEREIPIVCSVAKGSLINKVILIPLALLLSIYLPSAIIPLLLIGGAYLCFEGIEKILHKFLHPETHNSHSELNEKDKIKGAIRTDFILSAEIIIIALGVLQTQNTNTLLKILTLSAVGIGITFFVYGLVGLIVKLDDIGLWLLNKKNNFSKIVGKSLLFSMPYFMKTLSIIGTIAMFLVGGGIFSHNVSFIHHYLETVTHNPIVLEILNFAIGAIVGIICCSIFIPLINFYEKIRK